MAQRTQQPRPPPDSRPFAESVMVLAEDHVTALALNVSALGNRPTEANNLDTKIAPTTLFGVCAGKRETAVQVCVFTVLSTSH